VAIKIINDFVITCRKYSVPELKKQFLEKGYVEKDNEGFSARVRVESRLGHGYESFVSVKLMPPEKIRIILWRKKSGDIDYTGVSLILYSVFSTLGFKPIEILGQCTKCRRRTLLEECGFMCKNCRGKKPAYIG